MEQWPIKKLDLSKKLSDVVLVAHRDFILSMRTLIKEDGHWEVAKDGETGSPLIEPSDRDDFIEWGEKEETQDE